MYDLCIYTEYIPIGYRNSALIVQQSEDTELFGVLNNNGQIVVKHEYDSLEFVFIGGKE